MKRLVLSYPAETVMKLLRGAEDEGVRMKRMLGELLGLQASKYDFEKTAL